MRRDGTTSVARGRQQPKSESRGEAGEARGTLKKMFGDLPPSSSVAGMRFCAAAAATFLPTSVEPAQKQGGSYS